MKSVRIQSYSSPHFPAFRLNSERYSVSLPIHSERGNMRTRITPNLDSFYTVDIPGPIWSTRFYMNFFQVSRWTFLIASCWMVSNNYFIPRPYLLNFVSCDFCQGFLLNIFECIQSNVKWSDPGHFLESQGKFFSSFPCTLFLHIFDT